VFNKKDLADCVCSELELGAFMVIEMKEGLTAKGLRQAEVEYYLWAICISALVHHHFACQLPAFIALTCGCVVKAVLCCADYLWEMSWLCVRSKP